VLQDGKPALVQAASTNIHGPHGQYITNIHLEPYNSEEHFRDELYAKKYSRIFDRAEKFLAATGSNADDVIVFIS
jgi:histone deacetylase HOS3